MSNITTTCGEQFSMDDHARLAFLIHRRWGRDIAAGASAWRRLFQNSCTDQMFEDLVNQGALLSVEPGHSTTKNWGKTG